MGVWYNERLAHFIGQVAINGTTLTFNGLTADCLATPFAHSREIEFAGDFPEANTTFTIARTEYVRLGFRQHSRLVSNGTMFQVMTIMDDSSEPTVDVPCNALI